MATTNHLATISPSASAAHVPEVVQGAAAGGTHVPRKPDGHVDWVKLTADTPVVPESMRTWLKQNPPGVATVSADDYARTEPPPLDEVITSLIETGDKLAIISGAKMRKSFFALQMAVCVAAGIPFLGYTVPRSRRVLLMQYEVRERHYHRRVRAMLFALRADTGDRLHIANARGTCYTAEQIEAAARETEAELVVFDPLFRLIAGDENAAADFKVPLAAFDRLAERTGAAVAYVHHDRKGDPSERDIRDRGSGSGVLARDYDSGLTLTPHRDLPDGVVINTLTRNYAPAAPFVVEWRGGRFVRMEGVATVTGKPGKYDAAVRDYLAKNPQASVTEIASVVGCDRSTASRIRGRL